MKASFYVLILVAFVWAKDPVVPDTLLTPGDTVAGIDTSCICKKGYTKTVRNVPEVLRKEVFHRYHMVYASGYEVDHLISLELGGSNDIKNLWPETYAGDNGARKKDVLENKLHRLVCTGRMTLHDAQYTISHNWIEAYNKYISSRK